MPGTSSGETSEVFFLVGETNDGKMNRQSPGKQPKSLEETKASEDRGKRRGRLDATVDLVAGDGLSHEATCAQRP